MLQSAAIGSCSSFLYQGFQSTPMQGTTDRNWNAGRQLAKPLLYLLVCGALQYAAPAALAQFTQQGPKLVGTGAVGGGAEQGVSVALSTDGNTAIVGGPEDNTYYRRRLGVRRAAPSRF